mmetsp:Transcript_20895/g.26995  ORF Transcript_20895/g.26995 Transcript_20895/m.26995 type:complete len:204 (+) Transcript_20895:51-662(+)
MQLIIQISATMLDPAYACKQPKRKIKRTIETVETDQKPPGKNGVAYSDNNLVVLAISLSLGIQDTRPEVGFEVELGIDINLDFNDTLGLLNREDRNTFGGESSSNDSTNSRWAPLANNLTSLQVELGSQKRILDGSIIVDLSERKRLVDGWALVTKSVDRSTLGDGDADSKTSSNTRGSLTRSREQVNREAWHVLKSRAELGH